MKHLHIWHKRCRGTRVFFTCMHKPLSTQTTLWLILAITALFGLFMLSYEAKMTEAVLNATSTYTKPVQANFEAPVAIPVPDRDYGNPVANQIYQIAQEAGSPHGDYLVRLSYCESRWNERALGDQGNSRGIFQIHKLYHPTVTDDLAYNVEWATKWTLDKVSSGYQHLWSCDRIVRGNLSYLGK